MKVRAIVFGLIACLPGCASATEDGAEAIANRTRTTTSTYAAYEWGGAVNEDGSTEEHWTAEFHSGDWHRMEAPKMRVVANCRTHVGFFYDVTKNETTDAPNAYRGACRIYASPDVASTVRLPTVESAFGRLDRIQITDQEFVREYAITSRGVIMASDWNAKSGLKVPCIRSRTFAVLGILPKGAIFSRESLALQVTPPQYVVRPVKPKPIQLSGKSCGLVG